MRMGHPNQAVNSTFTAADPRHFSQFCEQKDVTTLPLPGTLDSAPDLIELAQHLVCWVTEEHPGKAVRKMAFRVDGLQHTDRDAGESRLANAKAHIHVAFHPFPDVDTEARVVASWTADYLRRYPDRTAAILCPAQWQGTRVVEALKAMSPPIPFDNLMRSTPLAQNIARILAAACDYLADPSLVAHVTELYAALTEGGYLQAPSRARKKAPSGLAAAPFCRAVTPDIGYLA